MTDGAEPSTRAVLFVGVLVGLGAGLLLGAAVGRLDRGADLAGMTRLLVISGGLGWLAGSVFAGAMWTIRWLTGRAGG